MTPAAKSNPNPPVRVNYLTEKQVEVMLGAINPRRVFVTEGQHNVAAWEIKAHLNRVFGFARWSANVIAMELIYDLPTETRAGKPAFHVAYRCGMQLDVHAPDGTHLAQYTEWAVGDSTMPDFKHSDCHDMAIKTAESQALKRCAINLGDQFGLGLYDKFNTLYNNRLPANEQVPSAVVKGVLVGAAVASAPDPDHQIGGEHDPDHPDADNEHAGEGSQEAPQAPQSVSTPKAAPPSTPGADRPQEQPAQAGEQPLEDQSTLTLSAEEEVVVRRNEFMEKLAELTQEQTARLKGMWKPGGMTERPHELSSKANIEKAWGLLNRALVEDSKRAEEVAQAQRHFQNQGQN